MATIYPNSVNLCRSNAEKKVLNCLKKFSDKFHIIQNLPWVSKEVISLTKHFSPEGEADFIILHEEYGLLVLEVKGGNITYNNHAYFTNGDELKQDPHIQSRSSAHYLRILIEKLSHNIIIGYAVIFPDSIKPNYHDFRRKTTFDYNDLNNFELNVLKVFEYWKSNYEKKRIYISNVKKSIDLIKRKLLPDSIDPLTQKIEFDNKNWLTLSEKQTDILKKILKSRRFFISGRAGTGKTIIAIILARLLNQKKEKTLFLTFNIELSEMIYKELKNNQYVNSTRFHQYLRMFADKINKEDSLHNEKEILEYLIKINKNDYDVLIIDEAQSLATIWLNLLSEHFKNKKIFIFSDELQSFNNEGNITNKQMEKIFRFEGEMALSVNYRSPFKVYKRLLEIFDSSIQQTTPRTIDNLDLNEIITDNPRGMVEENVDNLLIKGLKKEDIIILIPSSEGKNIKSYEYNDIKIQTVKKYRGMEKPIVIFVLGSVSRKDFNELYVAYSRSTTQTIVIIPERLLSFGKTKFEQILLESDLTDNKIKENIDTSTNRFYIELLSHYESLDFLNNKLYYTSKYFFLDIGREYFVNILLGEYLKKIDYPFVLMSFWDVKSGRLNSSKLLMDEYNNTKNLSFSYCPNCNTEAYKSFDFCLNCNLKYLNSFDVSKLLDLKILNNPDNYSKEERHSIDYALRIIGRYYYSKLNENLTKKAIDLLNNQSEVNYLIAMIDLLFLIYKKSNNLITLDEIKSIDTKLFNENNTKESNSKAGALVNMFIRRDIIKKEKKGVYSFEWEDIFINK